MDKSNQSLTDLALQKFRKNFWGVLSFWFIVLLVFVALFAYVLAPDKTKNANWGDLSLNSKPPGFEVTMLTLPSHTPIETNWTDYFTGKTYTKPKVPVSDYKIESDSLTYTEYAEDASMAVTKTIALSEYGTATDANFIIENYIRQQKFILGTDSQGRDLLSRLLIGSRVSIAIGFVAVFISLVVGIFFGAVAGYFGGKVDAFVMWLVNIIWSIPTLLLVIAITLALGKGFWQVFVAVGLTMWVEVARVVRGQVMSLKQMQFVTAARALGYHDSRIIFKHILPNSIAPVIVISAANFASAILVESGLSFLGLGAQPPVPSWGGMIKDHYNYIILGKPYLALAPGIAMLLLVLAFMMIGNALRDALDVKAE
ncbi:ABC transporter permease [Flavobacterium salilacus subsp. salilacus]|uniref:ABC transporter permease n=1 Tax=Flavobacterium TaxID=237 RepID=UPI0010756C52|nr:MULTISPECIES: ABC transporter permease [Flavobacterium]KAF2519960.1 ABC transporter permease [Flavobacterium salilacus subsp. salilacus]MBE1614129.1 ABC transporter permease [Flavobacterium sp. SaA2.13]